MLPRLARPFGPALLLWLIWSTRAWAHDPGLSALEIRPDGDLFTARLTLSWLDVERLVPLDADGNGVVSAAEFEAARPDLIALALAALELRREGRPLVALGREVALDASGAVHIELRFGDSSGRTQAAGARRGDARVLARLRLLARLPRGHRTYLAVRDAAGALSSERVLGAGVDGFALDAGTAAPAGGAPDGSRAFRRFLVLGIRHILTGYDHLAFLFALLVAGGSLKSAARIITSFTLAHSLTLALATFGLIHLPSRLTEPLIAASIVYVGLENVLQREPARRWLLTFGFGLVHGFGFASVLRDLGIGARGPGAAIPLFSFNAGVEIGQIAIASLTLPVIWNLSRRPGFASRIVPVCSLAVAVLGGWWLLQRTLLA